MSAANAPRIQPLPAEECRPDIAVLIRDGEATTGGASNVFSTLANNPGLFKRYIPFAGKLLAAGKLSPFDRELAILRTAHLCRCDYEWEQHARIGRTVGISEAQLDAVRAGGAAGGWEVRERALLHATDSLITEHTVEQATWDELKVHYSDEQLIELIMLVGHYAMLAGFLNAVGVPLEDAARPGSTK
jgi:4-carboxymuconolactone decarboxylase